MAALILAILITCILTVSQLPILATSQDAISNLTIVGEETTPVNSSSSSYILLESQPSPLGDDNNHVNKTATIGSDDHVIMGASDFSNTIVMTTLDEPLPGEWHGQQQESKLSSLVKRSTVEQISNNSRLPVPYMTKFEKRLKRRDKDVYNFGEEYIDGSIGLGDSEFEDEDDEPNNGKQYNQQSEDINYVGNKKQTRSASSVRHLIKRATAINDEELPEESSSIIGNLDRDVDVDDSSPLMERRIVEPSKQMMFSDSSPTLEDIILPLVRRKEKEMLSVDGDGDADGSVANNKQSNIDPSATGHSWTLLTTRKYLDEGSQKSNDNDGLYVEILNDVSPYQSNKLIDDNNYQFNSEQYPQNRPVYHGIYMPRFSRRSLFSL